MDSSSSSTLSAHPSYPGLHSGAQLQPKSPGSHSAREDATTWDAWRSEIEDLVDFLRTEAPPAPMASPKRGSRELLRSGSKHLRQSLRGRPLRNTWGSRQLRSLMGKQEQRFCHIVQDPEFLKDMADPGMYLINCNARALGRGLTERNSKGSVDWKALRISDITSDIDPDATLCGVPEPPRVPRVLSKRLPLSSHPSRGHPSCGNTVTIRANRDKRATRSLHSKSASAPRMQGAVSSPPSNDKLLPEVPTTTFDPFAATPSDPPSITRKPIDIEPPSATSEYETSPTDLNAAIRAVPSRDRLWVGTLTEPVTDTTPGSSIVHLPSVPSVTNAKDVRHQRSFPTVSSQDSPTSAGTVPFLSERGSHEDAFLMSSHTPPGEEPLIAANKPWLESRLTSKQSWRGREDSYSPPTRIPAPYTATSPSTLSSGGATPASESKANYAAAQNIWSANAALARRRMATRIDTTRRLKQRDFERARKASDASSRSRLITTPPQCLATAAAAAAGEGREGIVGRDVDLQQPPGTSHSSTHSEPCGGSSGGRCDVTSLPQPRTMRLQRAISYDGLEEPEPATSKALDWYAKSPVGQKNPWNSPEISKNTNTAAVMLDTWASRNELSPVYTVADRAPSPSPSPSPSPTPNPARREPYTASNATRISYRSQGTQCCIDSAAGAVDDAPNETETETKTESKTESKDEADSQPSELEAPLKLTTVSIGPDNGRRSDSDDNGNDTNDSNQTNAPPALARLETKLEAQLAHMDQRTKTLEALLLTFVRKAASRDSLGWEALSKAAASGADLEMDEGLSSSVGRINEAGVV